ncbi:MAG: hypothetical protein HN742_25415 [Lentisphaerae bacterium]|jgi:hypothetical protein|nr:hypothetical protein [Lentisphaerota bacterium]MBT5612260.1 hypothetical protein [Lentisphaerota bacterium]MBT7060762.1 hypothetical protein [Lentisphaerota bacterium]MBT7845239.1 hypothetical protein [Lentisphaerota bacterium]
MPEKPECYGTIFPDLPKLEHNRPCRGKVFTVSVQRCGPGVPSRSLALDQKEWDACQRCSFYQSCYDLCIAQLSLRSALARV